MEYKLTYFNFRGRAEASRLVFVLAGVPFEDVRIEWDDWADHRDNFKFHRLPTMETGGKIYTESQAIMCYLGRKFGFYPTDIEEAFKVDEVIFIMEEYMVEAIKQFDAPEDQMEAQTKEYYEIQVPKYNGFLEKLLMERDGGNGYFVGNKVTVADLVVFALVSSYPKGLKDYPLLEAMMAKIGNIDKIKDWVKTRPKTDF